MNKEIAQTKLNPEMQRIKDEIISLDQLAEILGINKMTAYKYLNKENGIPRIDFMGKPCTTISALKRALNKDISKT